MRVSLGQTQRQEQKQILTQRLIQSAELLQLPLQQLEERIETELETNPVLEILESPSGFDDEDNAGNAGGSDLSPSENVSGLDPSGGDSPAGSEDTESETSFDDAEEFERAADFSETYADTIDEAPIRSQNWLEEAARRHQDLISNVVSRDETLEEHLLDQLAWFDLSDTQRDACETIIGNISPNGILEIPIEELWGEDPGQAQRETWRAALKTVQSMDPPGVGARSVQEALLLQVSEEIPNCSLVRSLLEKHFDDILHNRIPLIVKETGYTKEQIEEGIAEIRKLNPYPGSGFGEEVSPAILPDLYVFQGEDGKWDVDVNEGNQIRLGINSEYKAMLKEKETDREAKDYLRKNIGQAQWFIEALRQRKMTLLRVGQAIVRHQTDFFEIGPEKLRPLKMQQVADELQIHIATVSRACDGKWMQGPRGIYPLRSFFSGAVKTESSSDELTSRSVKIKIKVLIEKEDKRAPLSDEEIVSRLKAEGIEISRRTVAKYRDALAIPSSRQRKEWS